MAWQCAIMKRFVPPSHADPAVCPAEWLRLAGGEPVVTRLTTALCERADWELLCVKQKRA